jgi:hypothetical protein
VFYVGPYQQSKRYTSKINRPSTSNSTRNRDCRNSEIDGRGEDQSSTSTVPGIETAGIQRSMGGERINHQLVIVPGIETAGIQRSMGGERINHQLVQSQE